ncbi:MAG: hypothetical protein EHM72_09555 [Calditrichaeota bacterium]|nr:MAG: hypothetical protein EHM72_09555 [Calditrichota bacterium]
MKINFSNKIFSSSAIKFIFDRLLLAERQGYIKSRNENNRFLIASYRGVEEKGISPKWNVKIYTFSAKKNGHSIVCVDFLVLKHLVEMQYDRFIPPNRLLLRIDDAGWGFPLCGVMVGVSDEEKVLTDVVPIEYFQREGDKQFAGKKYLKKYAELAINLMIKFDATPNTHRVEICSGYVNQPLREKLRNLGYDVRVVEIKGLLQAELENIFKKYIFETVGADIYYDPKEMKKSEIPKVYYKCLNYGLKNCPELIKSGWESLNDSL